MTAFRLYPQEQHWCSFADYGAILDVARRVSARRVLEIGPGNSTLALIEAGATTIDACEDDPHYFALWYQRLERRFPEIVRLHPFETNDTMIPAVHDGGYDLALIDGPRETELRPGWIRYAADRARYVLVPLECLGTDILARFVPALAAELGRPYERTETGPLAGAYGLIGPKC